MAGVCYTSEGDYSELTPRSPDKPFYVIRVACENYRFLANGCRHHDGVNDIRSPSLAQQPSCFVSLASAKRNDHTPGQEAPELGLPWRPADLGNDWRRNRR